MRANQSLSAFTVPRILPDRAEDMRRIFAIRLHGRERNLWLSLFRATPSLHAIVPMKTGRPPLRATGGTENDMPDGAAETRFPATDLNPADQRLSLRILATTDLHMNVLPYDYLADRPCPRHGLARTASLIRRKREAHKNCLLLDNGDVLQGNPMGDYIAKVRGIRPNDPHPAIAAMNALHYDAAALGNHDFNYGLTFLRRTLAQAEFPFLAANLRMLRGQGFGRYVILRRMMVDHAGRPHEIRIGIAGFLPPQTCDWDHDLSGQMACDDIVETARTLVPEMRADGAQLIVALSHSGIGPAEHRPGMEHAATALAAVEGIDVVIAGHTHQVFPGPQIPAAPGIDPLRGTLAGKPAVMAGFGGSHLGVIDLELERDGASGLRIAAFRTSAVPVDSGLPVDAGITTPALQSHRATLRHFRRRVGHTEAPLNSYFSLVGVDPGLRLVNMAQRWHVRNRLAGTKWQGVPVLSAAAPFRAGGRGGPDHYTDVPAGALTLRSLADLYLFPNRVCALRLTGRQLRSWLERSAGIFNIISPGQRDASLIDPEFPCYNFDVVDGVNWQIDLSAKPGAGRVTQLRLQGRPLKCDDTVILATNSYRFATCGLFGTIADDDAIVLRDTAPTRDVLRCYVRRRRRVQIDPTPAWSFVPMTGTTVLFETSPAALPHLDQFLHSGRSMEFAHMTSTGFAAIRLSL